MKRPLKFALGGIAGTMLVAAATVYGAGAPTVAGYAARLLGPGVAHAAGMERGWRGHGRGFDRICSDQRNERLESMIQFADAFLKLEPNQTKAWNDLTAALRAGSAKIGETCASMTKNSAPATAPEKLAALETVMTTGVGILHDVRPAFDAFYSTLDTKQKAAIDGLLAHHRHHRRR